MQIKEAILLSEHPIQSIMGTTLENMKEMIDVNTIVGDAVETVDGTVIIPISRLSFGFVTGGSEFNANGKETNKKPSDELTKDSHQMPFGGGTGAGISVYPMAFLVVGQGQIRLLHLANRNTADRIAEMIPEIMEEIKSMTKKNKENVYVKNNS